MKTMYGLPARLSPNIKPEHCLKYQRSLMVITLGDRLGGYYPRIERNKMSTLYILSSQFLKLFYRLSGKRP